MKIILRISFYFSVLPLFAFSKPPIKVNASYFLDTFSKFNLYELENKKFEVLRENETLNIGYNEDLAVWVKLRLKNQTSQPQSFWLVLNNNRLDSVQLFDKKQISILGDRTHSNLPFISYPAFQISLKPNSSATYYLRLKKGISFMDFSFHLESDKSIQRVSNRFFFFLSLILGIVLTLIISNTVLYLINRKKIYLIYVSYSVLSTMYILIATGFAKFIIFPSFLYFSEGLIYFGTIWFLILFLFLTYFLNLKKYDPKIYKYLLVLIVLTSIYIVSSIFFYALGELGWLKILSTLNYVNFLLLMILMIASGIRHLKVNKRNAIYVLLSFFPHFVWSISIVLKAFGVFKTDLHINWLVVLSFYDILLFGFVLVRFYFDTFRNNQLLNEEIIAEKESKMETIMATQINERQSIANLIHDYFGSSIGHILQISQQNPDNEVTALLQNLSQNIREVSHEIMPKSIEDGALSYAVENQIRILNKTLSTCVIEFQNYDFPPTIDVKMAQNLYLIFLELINNALKHGQANFIQIELYGYNETILLQCTDNGMGLDITKTELGFGLTSIKDRIQSMNGILEVTSELLKGTVVQIEIKKNTY
jgi:signal transduction histidine kinase